MKSAIDYLFFLFLAVFTLLSGRAISQTCKGALGDPIINIDFGRGSASRGPSLGNATGYNYTTGNVSDGSYTLAKSTAGLNNGWYTLFNHTPDDPNGYMMVVNSDPNPGVFYESDVAIELCQNTTYEFAAWVANMLRYSGLKPNITFVILDENNQELQSYNTGDIPDENPSWKQYGFLFSTTTVSRVKIRMINNVRNASGAGGNDVVLDDITFRACGPDVTATINGEAKQMEDICIGDSEHYDFSAIVSPGVYNSPEFMWQKKRDDGAWEDLPGERTQHLGVDFDNAQEGLYQYRLLVAENGNINTRCRTASSPFTIRVNAPPQAIGNGPLSICRGFPINLNVSAALRYEWTGPNGFSSNEQSPRISSATTVMAGTYSVTLWNAAGCSATTSVIVSIVEPTTAAIVPIMPICEGASIVLQASGGPTYSWSPATGLSATDIPNPIARPTRTTLYTVRVSNGSCETTAQVNVVVLRKPTANAGSDKKILEGESVVLNGTSGGDGTVLSWSPAEGLSNPGILNPVASPKKDMTYTLSVSSVCGVVTDQVFVRVYQTVKIPNVFSPNSDGLNDTWKIGAIESYEQPIVRVMNRSGELVFESTGYDQDWDGKQGGKDLPVGVYYYVIRLAEDLKPQTGSVTILR
ncbi:gliding motility-associated C-terminal domain-containing protein [Pedobacter sp. GR22-6]|uniref:gliding motility-associated C-terminal domain-containing protein n=1 Tax=Pedobacter sp. GR22-6 TaxID=3127957 RepID=UPI00307FCF3F